MEPRRAAALAIVAASLNATAASPQVEELMALDRKLARSDCMKDRAGVEMFIAGGAGDSERVKALQASMGKEDPAEAGSRARRSELGKMQLAGQDRDEYMRHAMERAQACPYRNIKVGQVPQELPLAKTPAEAQLYLDILVPTVLAKWRVCEALAPERRGELERTWTASRLSKVDAPQMQAWATDIRAWMKEDFKVDPKSQLAKDKAAGKAVPGCTGGTELKRIEAAMPAGFLK